MPSQDQCHWPDFILFGTGKSGTTAFFEALCRHPRIFGSNLKEPNYFSYPELGRCSHPPGIAYRSRNHTPAKAAYHSLFAEAPAESLNGEGSVGYLIQPHVPARIHQILPQIKLIAIFRHPVDRAYSSWLHRRRDSVEPISDFMQACAVGAERVRSGWEPYWDYLNSSRYSHHLRAWLTVFPREQFKFFLYEDWLLHPHDTLAETHRFLGLEPYINPEIPRVNITSSHPRSTTLGSMLRHENRLRVLARNVLPDRLRSGITGFLHQINRRPPPPLAPALRQQLTTRFAEDIRELQVHMNRNLDSWLHLSGTH